jgi:hypothetical protein
MSPNQTRLLDALLHVARGLLTKNGEFSPIGAQIDADGALSHIMPYDGREFAPSLDLLQILRELFLQRAMEQQIIASALAYDCRVQFERGIGDAVVFELEDAASEACLVYVPYSKQGRAFAFRGPSVQPGVTSIFGTRASRLLPGS